MIIDKKQKMKWAKYFGLIICLIGVSCVHNPERETASSPQKPQTIGGQMVKGISVAYIHTPNKKLADWYEKTLGLKKGYGDQTWQSFETSEGSSFALDFISYPSSTVQKQSIMISFAVDDVHATVEELAKKGVRFYPDNDKKRTIFDVGSSLVATFEDPDGNFIQISQQKK